MLKPGRGVAALATTLLLPLAACGDDAADAPFEPQSFGSEIIYTSETTVHFVTAGKEVDVERDLGSSHYSTAGLVVSAYSDDSVLDEDLFLVREDGSITEIEVPAHVTIATDPESPYLAWTDQDSHRGTVVVVNLLTGEEEARIKVPGKPIHTPYEVSIDGDVAWLRDAENHRAYRINWRTEKVTKADAHYLRQAKGDFGVTAGGFENLIEAGLGRPAVVNLRTGELVVRGGLWDLSPAGTAIGTQRHRYASDGDTIVSSHLEIRGVPKGRTTRFPIADLTEHDVEWGWTADGTGVLWFEGTTLHTCVIATKDCTTMKTDIEPGFTSGSIPRA